MRLFHISEESDIKIFHPRIPARDDLDKNAALVWAIDEKRLVNYLVPRDCPRVTYYTSQNTSDEDKGIFFSSPATNHRIILEKDWFKKILDTTLYIYEFNIADFELQDEIAGYYVAKTTQIPTAKYTVTDIMGELLKRNVEVRFVDNLWHMAARVQKSTLNWSLIKMGNAKQNTNNNKQAPRP